MAERTNCDGLLPAFAYSGSTVGACSAVFELGILVRSNLPFGMLLPFAGCSDPGDVIASTGFLVLFFRLVLRWANRLFTTTRMICLSPVFSFPFRCLCAM